MCFCGIICPLCHVQVKNVYQTSFSAFLDSLDHSRSPDFPQVGGGCQNTCSTVWFNSISSTFTVSISHLLACCCLFFYVLVSDRCWLLLLLLIHVCSHITSLTKMFTQAGILCSMSGWYIAEVVMKTRETGGYCLLTLTRSSEKGYWTYLLYCCITPVTDRWCTFLL